MALDDQRFGGIARLYGSDGLARLQAAHVAVVGIGGVGSWVAEALARTGVGELSLFDLDDVCITNTNRQVHALQGAVGRAKVEVMAERIHAINPACRVHAVADFVTRDNLAELITPQLDMVIDCIDSVAAKAALIAWCKRRKIAIVTTGGAGGQIDPTQIRVSDLSQTVQDPLLAKVRSTLRRTPSSLNRSLPPMRSVSTSRRTSGCSRYVRMSRISSASNTSAVSSTGITCCCVSSGSVARLDASVARVAFGTTYPSSFSAPGIATISAITPASRTRTNRSSPGAGLMHTSSSRRFRNACPM